ncbi:MAG TPA: 6-bladed beta-propeller, partial [Solirubrobacterales bacterium]|nr:6-bladed beta-propeller [Solirubrobacterales bacterium]
MVTVIPALALADEGEGGTGSSAISAEGIEVALGSQRFEAPPTNPQAAEELPHTDLGREEAIELATGVFEPQLQAPAGIFDELEVEKFLSANAAIVGPGDAPEPEGGPIGEGSNEEPLLLESIVPLRTEDQSGDGVAVDLSLEHSEGQIQPAEPLTEVSLPEEISGGIEFPGSGVSVELEDAPATRSASIIDESVAFYPNVATDTDLSLAPSPYGLDTLTQVRSADAPDTQTLRLHLPQGASLKATEAGGAEVLEGGETVLSIPAPSAIDANGDSVPVSLEVVEDALTVRATLGQSTAYPVLVDPAFEEWNWAGGHSTDFSAWTATTNSTKIAALNHVECVNSYECLSELSNGEPGLYLLAKKGPFPAGAEANWSYFVPRWASDQEKYGVRPQSFIASMTIERLGFASPGFEQPLPTSPQLIAGIWNTESSPEGWASSGSVYHHSKADTPGFLLPNGTKYTIPGNNVHDAKRAVISLAYPQAPEAAGRSEVFAGNVAIAVGDEEPPAFGSISGPGWIDSTASPIHFRVADTGLGVKAINIGETVINAQGEEVWRQLGSNHTFPWTTYRGCAGTAANPCPRVWSSSESGVPQLTYYPAELSQGVHRFTVEASDPIAGSNNKISAPTYILIKIDRTAPEVSALTGSLTTTGAKVKPKDYAVTLSAKDGTEAAPQSGVGSVEFKVDGTQVKKVTCEKQSCALEPEWVLHTAEYAVGSHTVEALVEDRVGHVVKKEAKFTIEKDTAAPEITTMAKASGSYPSGTYPLQAAVADKGAGIAKLELLVDGKRFGSPVAEPCAEANEDEEEGHCFTATATLSQVFQVNMAEYSPGSHALELIATDGYGNVARKQGTMSVETGVGSKKVAPSLTLSGTLTEQASLGTTRPQYALKLESASGYEPSTASPVPSYSTSFSSSGSGEGQVKSPAGVEIDSAGDIWVADSENNRVEEFSSAGKFLFKFGKSGTGNGEFHEPRGIAIDPSGNLWVTDAGNHRVQKFNSKGEFLLKIEGSGTTEGKFSEPEDVAVDSK